MAGFTRDQAARALALGWTQEEILDFHEHLKLDGADVEQLWDWGLAGSADWTFYRGTHYEVVRTRAAAHPCHLVATAYCDGSGTTMEKVAGIGVHIVYGNGHDLDHVNIAENIGLGTNNRAELCAIWRALRQFPRDAELLIRSDSEYAIGALTLDWARNVNGGLIRRIREDLDGRTVKFEHVDGHSGIEGNEIADQLAKAGRKLVTRVTSYMG